MNKDGPVVSELWLEIDITQTGDVLSATAWGAGQDVQWAPHSLGARFSPETVHQFGEWVKTAALDESVLTRSLQGKALHEARELHDALFQQGLRDALLTLQGAAKGMPVLLRLNPKGPRLKTIPWEALYRPGPPSGFLGTSQEVFLARGVESTGFLQPREVKDAVRLLVISPSDKEGPDRLYAKLQPSIQSGEIKWLEPLTGSRASASFVKERLRHGPTPHILHFIGHGELAEESLCLRMSSTEGAPSWLKVRELASELSPAFPRDLRLIVLEPREGANPDGLMSAAELLVQSGAAAVVAYLWPVKADVARHCAMALYRSLTLAGTAKGDVARGLHDARSSVLEEFNESAEAFSPVLYLRGCDSNLFDFRRRTLEAAPLPAARADSTTETVSSLATASLDLWLSVPVPAAFSGELLTGPLSTRYEARASAPALQEGRFILPIQLPREKIARLLQDAESGALDSLLGQVGVKFIQEIREGSRCHFSYVPPVTFGPPPVFEAVTSRELQGLLPRVDVLLLTTTEVERNALYEVLKPFPGRRSLVEGSLRNTTYRLGQFGQYVAAHVESTMGSMGHGGSTLTMGDAIKELAPKAIVMVGIAFGIGPDKQRLGDVIVAETVFPYELQRVGERVVHRGQPLPCGPILSERFRTRRADWKLGRGEDTVNVFQSPLLSGEKLTDDLAFRDALLEAFPTAQGGEMEGAGAYAAAQRMNVEVILVKAICDWADGYKNDRAQPFAARAAVSLVHHVLGKRGVLESLGARDCDPPGGTVAFVPLENPAVRSLLELLQKPFSLLLGDHWSGTFEPLRKLLHEQLQEAPWTASEHLTLSALAQRYALQSGEDELSLRFQEAVNRDVLPSMPLVDVLARWLRPGFHITLLRQPVLELALATHRPDVPLYIIQPAKTKDRPHIRQYVAGKGWMQCATPPTSFDTKRDVVLVRLYRGYLPGPVFSPPLLTEDDYLRNVRELESVLPQVLADQILSTLANQPALVLGMSLLSWDHRHLLQCLFNRAIPDRSTVLLEPEDATGSAWYEGRGLPRGRGIQTTQVAFPELTRLLEALRPGESS
ncbi:hypothetical protein BO221_38810 [Archangium sp. Cb G35]|uniref:CHAT domain-containing protein n=1 Tax=Archangium sp. Cb G35 TaxID=1920190 RepID=UPI0009371753|nr:CHAT domain-containing protein [Archangium sp. Cb G35]OJT18693.1 hypothetical protein BO221_38810 [Archangium sp. Cb G35]